MTMRRRRLGLLVCAAAALPLALLLGACGSRDDDPDPATPGSSGTVAGAAGTPTAIGSGSQRPPSTGGTAGGPEPVLPKPVARYTLKGEHLQDGAYVLNLPETFLFNIERMSTNAMFLSATEGDTLLKEWGFIEGYNVQFDPDGLLAGVLQGGYFLTVETYLFETPQGAHNAYERFIQHYAKASGSVRQQAAPLGNESSAWRVILGKVGRSDIDNVYHRFIFRRGNMIAAVQVNGGAPYVSVDIARDYAVIIDDQALGKRPAELPTPQPTPRR